MSQNLYLALGGVGLALLALFCFKETFRKGVLGFVWRHKFLFGVPAALFLLALNVVGFSGTIAALPLMVQLIVQLTMAVLFMGLQFGAMMYFMSRARVYWIMPGDSPVSFDDYRGNPAVLERAREVVQMLKAHKNPEVKKTGVQPVRGLLLEGPPGTGKSYLGQCIANEAGVPFAYCSSPSLQSAFMGMSAMTVWRLYKKANRYASDPRFGAAIIFMDEIDAVGRSRGNDGPGGMMGGMMMGGGSSQILNEILTQMDPPPVVKGWKLKMKRALYRLFGRKLPKVERETVLTVGATNLVSTLDAALLRPGRFDRHITVDHPDSDGRLDILQYYFGKMANTLSEEQVHRIKRRTTGYSPVALKHIINEGLIIALTEGRMAATLEDVLRAQNIHEFGVPQPIRSMSEEEKRLIAYHEAGHALVAVLLWTMMVVEIATIIRRGGALGLVGSKPDRERYTRTKEQILQWIDVCVASRAVEEVFLGLQMNGFSGDLQSATQAAVGMIGAYGMGTRMISYAALGGNAMASVANEAASLIEARFKLIKEFVGRNPKAIHAIANALLEQGDIDGPEVIRIVRENAEFVPAEGQTLADALPEILDEDETIACRSAWNAERALKHAKRGEKDGDKEDTSKPAAESQS
jgi:cell division protease FtsH